MQEAVVDACCLINFVATDCLSDVIRNSGLRWHVPPMVLQEVVYVADDDESPRSAAELLQLQFDLGALAKCQLEAPEQSLFLKLAVDLADGEAAALSIAATRGWWLATDDRKAIRLAHEHQVSVITTPQLARRWAEHSAASPNLIHDTLSRIRTRAHFLPRRDAPEYIWWMQHLGI